VNDRHARRPHGSVHLLEDIPLTLPERVLLRTLKLPDVESIDEIPERGLREDVWRAVHTGLELADPRAAARWLGLAGGPDALDQLAPELFEGMDLVGWLEGCNRVTLIAITLGDAFDARIEALRRETVTEAWYLDAVGTTLLSAVTETVGADVSHAIRKAGYQPTPRYAPGDGDWPEEVQFSLLQWCGASEAGIGCDALGHLTPPKSATAIIGWIETSESGRL
jgi:hypothetical protein